MVCAMAEELCATGERLAFLPTTATGLKIKDMAMEWNGTMMVGNTTADSRIIYEKVKESKLMIQLASNITLANGRQA